MHRSPRQTIRCGYTTTTSCSCQRCSARPWIRSFASKLDFSCIRPSRPRRFTGTSFLFSALLDRPGKKKKRILPVRKQVLTGILNSDLVGFHTYDYARHFLSSCTVKFFFCFFPPVKMLTWVFGSESSICILPPTESSTTGDLSRWARFPLALSLKSSKRFGCFLWNFSLCFFILCFSFLVISAGAPTAKHPGPH